MTTTMVFAGDPATRAEWAPHLERAAAASATRPVVVMDPSTLAPSEAHYLLYAPDGPVSDLSDYANLRAILSLWAGVDGLFAPDQPLGGDSRRAPPTGVPLARMVEPGLTLGMVDYVVGHVMRAHLGVDAQWAAKRARRWDARPPPLAQDRLVGVMGLGQLGAAAAEALTALWFQVRGWSRTPKRLERVTCFAGLEALDAFLDGIDVLVALVPLTTETRGLLNARRLERLAPGAHVINAARGGVLVEADLLSALDREGGLSGATLDVFDEEPLPQTHPFWAHDRILVTPHVASATRPSTAAPALLAQIDRCERGEPLSHVVDFARGY